MSKKKTPKGKNYIFRMCDDCERKTKFYIKYKNHRFPKYLHSPLLHFFWRLFRLNSYEKIKERIETCSKCGNIYITDMKK